MKENAFKSKYTLAFKNKTTEKEYKKVLESRVTLFNKIISFLLFGTTFLCLMLIKQKMDLESRFNPLVMIIPNGIVAFLFFLSFILSIFIKSRIFHDCMKYFIYIMMTFTFIFLRYYTRALAGVDMIAYTSVMNVEFIARIFFVLIGIFSFLEILIMSILVCIVFFSFNYPVFGPVYLVSVHVAYYTLIITVIIISYYYVGEKRSSFFYNHKLEDNNYWYNDVLDNMNNGFICIQNKNFKFINKTLIDLIKRKFNGEKDEKNLHEINTNVNALITNKQLNLDGEKNDNNVECTTDRRISSENIICMDNYNYNHAYNIVPQKSENTNEKISVTEFCDENTNTIINYLFNEENFDFTNCNSDIPKESDHQDMKDILIKDANIKVPGFSTAEFLGKLKKKYIELKYKEANEQNNPCESIKNENKLSTSDKKHILNLKNFLLMGNKKFEFKEEEEIVEKIFEISFRYYTHSEINNLDLNECDHFEFIFNDVTRTKLMEEKNAEFKYKSLFLSKIAHEFKNPLICITELVDQTCDLFNNDSSNNFMMNNSKLSLKQLKSIKSLSDYLLILIKDLDYFSQRQLEKEIDIVPSEINLSEILNFTKNVGKSLLMKNGKSKDVKIIIQKTGQVPRRIWTDEIRLKQILINLLSNAIKFTNRGYIKISLSVENSMLKFLVADTGIGMTSMQMDSIFKPFKKGKDLSNVNRYGSGLGLSIVYEMTQKLGSSIKYYSKEGEGTKFWFSISAKNSRLNSTKEQSKKKSGSAILSQSRTQTIIRKNSTNIADYFNTHEITKLNSIVNVNNNNIGSLLDNANDLQMDSDINDKISESNYVIRICPNSICHQDSHFSSSEDNSESESSTGTKVINSINLTNPPLTLLKEGMQPESLFPNIKHKRRSESDKRITDKLEINHTDPVNFSKKSNLCNSIKLNSNMNLNNFIFTDNNCSREDFLKNFKSEPDSKLILIVDDEKLTRQSTLRMMKKICTQMGLKVNILEAEDGIECVYLLYKLINVGLKISGIISDETMNYMNGTMAAQIIGEIQQKKGISKIPYFILTAYEDNYTLQNMMNQYINDIFTKPLMNVNAEKFLNSLASN